MKLSQVAEILGAVLNGRDAEIMDVVYFSKDVTPGALFVCITGKNDAGHRYAPEAQERGAAALLCERGVDVEIPQLIVPNARDAMNLLASPYFSSPSSELPIVGVTGTNGKTTTTFMIESIVRVSGARAGLIGTVEVHIGDQVFPGIRTTPESIDLQRMFRQMVQLGVGLCAMEVTSEGVEAGRIEGTRFAATVFTNLSQDHLDSHGTMENYFTAKRKVFAPQHSQVALINVDDKWGERLARESEIEIVRYGLVSNGDLRATEVQLTSHGSKFQIVGGGRLEGFSAAVATPIPGRFNVYNAIAAAGACAVMGMEPDVIAEGIGSLQGVPGRFEPVDRGQSFSVIVDYAHTPDSLANVLDTARELSSGRVIAVFGCGGDRDPTKRPLMGKIAGKLADLVIVTSDNPRSEEPEAILRDITVGIDPSPPPLGFLVRVDRAEAISIAINEAVRGDVVVIAGKGHETGQEFADRKEPFDDRLVAAQFIEQRLAENQT